MGALKIITKYPDSKLESMSEKQLLKLRKDITEAMRQRAAVVQRKLGIPSERERAGDITLIESLLMEMVILSEYRNWVTINYRFARGK